MGKDFPSKEAWEEFEIHWLMHQDQETFDRYCNQVLNKEKNNENE